MSRAKTSNTKLRKKLMEYNLKFDPHFKPALNLP